MFSKNPDICFKNCLCFQDFFQKVFGEAKNLLEKLRGNRDWHSVATVHVLDLFLEGTERGMFTE
jgi:hypothetical protein